MHKAEIDLEELFCNNPDFKAYVNKHSALYNISIKESLSHKMVEEYAKYLIETSET